MNLLTTAGGPMSSSRSTKFTSHVETGHLMTDLKSNAKTAALAQRHSSLRLNAATQRMRSAVDKELKKCCHESLAKKGIGRYDQAVSYNIIKETGNNDHVTKLSELLAPKVQEAPLKTVLNNLDALEELVLVLDPDISGAKNTRHLAAQCSFSFAWINYAYSMKEHKSPLVAVLEGVVAKNPDWTVGHLAELLSGIGRNDAVEILAKLPAGV
ncbi:IGF-like family receptor 1 [Labeo rohita]|uniref:IGF-like family receptor 1 n=1 Tax=Labeo rohita TaxID=84645 RepID=A0A498N2T1_LABRO|nr:IGF-like family receptor 1 [Labeo rohita]